MTIPKPYLKATKDLVDFMIKKNASDKIELILWKIKNYDEVFSILLIITLDLHWIS
jgi:hypothetical protein